MSDGNAVATALHIHTPARVAARCARVVRAVGAAGAIGALLLLAGPANAADVSSSQAADMVIGSPSLTSTSRADAMDRGFDTPSGVSIDASGRFLVSDFQGHRVGIYNSLPSTDGAPFDVVAGKASKFDYRGGCGPVALSFPTHAASGGGRLVVPGFYSQMVTLYDSVPTTDGATASRVLGQTDFGICASPSGPTATSFQRPSGSWTDGTRLIVADQAYHRVMIWNSWPTTNNQPADIVLGQASKTVAVDDDGAPGASSLDAPKGVWSDGTRILVADMGNHRVLAWNSWPTADGQAADRVIGQPNFTTETSGGCNATGLELPSGVSSNGTRIVVTSQNQNRTLLYDTWPTADNPTPNRVLGQTVNNACSPQRGNQLNDLVGMRYPGDVATDGNRIAVADRHNNRVLVWTSWPTSDGAAADRVLGQPNGVDGGVMASYRHSVYHYAEAWGETASIQTSNGWNGIWPAISPNGDLWVADAWMVKLRRYATPVSTNNPQATWVFGQANPGYSNWWRGNWTMNGQSMARPMGVWTDGTKMLLADVSTNRVMVWNSYPTIEDEAATATLGAPDVTTWPTTGSTSTTFDKPMGVASDGTRVAVTDHRNNRVMLWNSWPSSGQAADLVLGQPDFGSSTSNNGGVSARSLNGPVGIAMWNGKLAVADQDNNRILIWNTWPTSSYQPADAVYGQPDFTSNAVADARTPKGIAIDGNTLFFTDRCRARYLDPIPTSGAVASGAAEFGVGCGGSTPSATNVAFPTGIAARGGVVWVANDANARLMRWQDGRLPTITAGPSVSTTCSGTATISWTTSESGTTEVYWDTASRASVGTYASSSIDTSHTGLARARTIGGLTAGTTYYYRLRTVDWAGNEVVSAEATFVGPAPCGPTSQFVHDSEASAGAVNPTAISSSAPHFSWNNNAGTDVDRIRAHVVTTPLDDVASLWHLDGTGADVQGGSPVALGALDAEPGYVAAPGSFDRALSFDGIDDRATAAHAPRYDLAGNFTVEAWFRTTNVTNSSYPTIVAKQVNNTNRNFYIGIFSSGMQASVSVAGTQYSANWAEGGAFADGAWHHVALVVDGANTLQLYADGVLRASTALPASPVATPAVDIHVGGFNGNAYHWFDGQVDELRISSVARSAQEISGYYRTRAPHFHDIWDSDPAQTGLATIPTCGHLTRCADAVFGATGTSVPLIRDGARYFSRARVRTTSGTWSEWGSWDWFETQPATTLTISTGGTASLGSSLPGEDVTATSSIEVATTNASGYSLTAAGPSDTAAMTAGGNSIPPWTGTDLAPSIWPAGTSGYMGVTVLSATGGKDPVRWGTGVAPDDHSSLAYAGPRQTQPVTLHARTSWSSGTDTIVVAYRANPAAAQPPGSYSTTIAYTATANP